jgi:Spy/CpxP family protein refolding chaperone
MTPPMPPTSKAAASRPIGGREALRAALVLLLALLVGGVAGIALDRLLLLPHLFMGGPGWHEGPPRGGGGRPRHDRGFRDRFAREVGLTPEQQTRIDSIMDREGRELRAIRSKSQPELDSIVTRTRRQLDSVLTPEQRTKAETLRKRYPPPRGGPGGPGGPEGPPPDGRPY